MEYRTLGKSGLAVSRLCFGTLTVGPLQANLPPEEGAEVLSYAVEKGVNFLDTAQYYRNYETVGRALKKCRNREKIIVSTKTYAYTRELAEEAFEEARKALDRDVIDIFMLHEQESIHTLRGHAEALDFFFEQREKGKIRAVGASMHHIAAVDGVCSILRDFDVIHPLYNIAGLGIADGTRDEMGEAIAKAHRKGIGVLTMQALGGGNLFGSAADAFSFVLRNPNVDAVAVGMQSLDEVDANIGFFEEGVFSPEAKAALDGKKRRLFIEDYCSGCGKCVERCGQKALSLQDGVSVCDESRCLLCGYCAAVCRDFAIKVL